MAGRRGKEYRMKAQVLQHSSPMESRPLKLADLPVPRPKGREILVRVSACGVCHTELDEIEGRIQPRLPIVLGHEIVGRVKGLGAEARRFHLGDRGGMGWINC